jgi:DNA invertase Pin-like site-specific DNA recombinase
MEYVEIRKAEKEKKEGQVRKLRILLEQVDRKRIMEKTGLSKDTVYKTLKRNPTLLSEKVIQAGIEIVEERTGKKFEQITINV